MEPDLIRKPALLATIFAFILIEFLQSGMIGFAAGPTLGQISAAPEQYSMVSAVYASAAVLSISQMTVLIQRLGWRDYLLGSTLLFLFGTWICADSDTVVGFLAGRVLMALGGGVFMSAARLLINFLPPPQRLIGITAFACALASGLSAAPWLAGFMVGHEMWGGMFLVLALLAACAGWLASRYLPADCAMLDTLPSRFNLGDGVALGTAAFLILYGLQRLTYDWYGERVQVVALLSCGLALAGWFFASHWRTVQPFLRLEMLSSRRFVMGLLIFTLCYVLLGVFNTVMPQLIQGVMGIAFEQAGQVQGAGLSASILAVVIMLFIVRKYPHATKFYVTAFLLLVGFGWHFSRVDPVEPAWTSIAPWIALFGAFITLSMATTALHSFKDLHHDNLLFSHAQQFKNMLGQLGLALGTGCASITLQQRGALHASRLAESSVATGTVLAQQGNLLSSIDLFLAITWIAMAGAVILAMQKRFD